MQKLILTLIVVLTCAPAWGTVYYVDPLGSGTTCSQAAPCLLDYAVATKSAAGDTIMVNAGTHGPFAQIAVTKALTISGAGEETTTINFNAAAHGFNISGSGTKNFSNFTIGTGGDSTHRAIFLDGATNNTFTNVTINNWSGESLYARTSATATFNNFTIKNCNTTTATAALLSTSTTIWNNCKFLNNGNSTTGNDGIINVVGGTATFNNPTVVGNQSGSGYSPIGCSSGSLVMNNPLIAYNNPSGTVSYVVKQSSTGAITLNNPLLLGTMLRPGYTTTGTVTINNAPTAYGPIFSPNGKSEGFVTFAAVDSNHTADGSGYGGTGTSLGSYQGVFDSLGVHFTYFPDDVDHLTIAQKNVLQTAALSGHDIGCEGNSSSRLDELVPFTVTYSGGGANPRVIITYSSRTDATLSLVTDSGVDLVTTIGIGQSNPYIGNSLSQSNTIVKAINDHSDWSVTLLDTNSFDDAYAYILAAGTTQVTGTANINIDPTKYYNEEITISKNELESAVREYGGVLSSYSAKSYMCARYAYSAGTEAVIKASGFASALSGSTSAQDLSSISSMYAINNAQTEWAYWNSGGTEETIRRNAATLAGLVYHGKWITIVLPENAGATSAELGYFISELKRLGIPIRSFREAAEYFAAGNGYTPNGDGYTKSLSYSSTYRPLPNSPAIGAGSNAPINGVASATDPDGRPITDHDGNVFSRWVGGVEKATVDIGAYQYPSDALTITSDGAKGGYFNTAHPYAWALPDSPAGYSILASGDQDRQFSLTMTGLNKGRIKVRLTDGVGAQLDNTIPIGVSGGSGGFRW